MKPRTLEQNTVIHTLLARQGIDRELKAEMVREITAGRTDTTKEMYYTEANEMIVKLGGEMRNSAKRTRQALRQKAGVIQMISPEQSKLVDDLATTRWGQGWNQPLKSMCQRMLRTNAPRTTIEANKIIEAIKAMNARDQKSKEAA